MLDVTSKIVGRGLSIAVLIGAFPLPGQEDTALDRYVKAADPSYGWELRSTHPGLGIRTFNLRMTSQTWLTASEVSGNRWQHWLRVTVPSNVQSSKAVLLINGGNTDEVNPGAAPFELSAAVALTGIVLAELRAVPNQPLTFAGEASARSEDAILAYSWDKYLRTGDEKWPAQLAMTKAAVRAMDAVSEFCARPEAGGHKIDGYVVGGGSKRGWISWLTAAVDRRV
ncbi:MAG: PhoPQ-activated pathogenicity, partial [Acidobacteriia bacterium]|nr:PhoPQ-activated pathogenicity [Terriglobia bacterium]